MPLFHSKKVLFLHNPKTGGTTIEKVFDLDVTRENLFTIGDVKYFSKHQCSLQHLSYIELKRRIPSDIFDSYYKFTFVRNPWDRIVSTYCWDKREFKTFEKFVDFVETLYNKYTVETLTDFPEFSIKYCAHLYPQYIYTGEGVDVYRYENFTSEMSKIMGRFNISDPTLGKDIPLINSSSHGHYSSYYNDRTREVVRKIYAEDIRRFGYTFESE